MSDLASGIVLAWAVLCFSAGLLGLACRSELGRRWLRVVFGSARGALLSPPVAGCVTAAVVYASHRQVLVNSVDLRDLFPDSDGCVHWLLHTTQREPTILAALLIVGTVGGGLLAIVRGRRVLAFRRGLAARVNRSATRRLRRSVGQPGVVRRVYAVDTLETTGPIAVGLGRRCAIFLPTRMRLGLAEMRAVLAHERTHLERGHLLRRWLFEDVLFLAVPRALLGPCLAAAREEEEWEADDHAARVVGDRAVALAVVRAAAATLRREERHAPAPGAGWTSGDLRVRVERLLSPMRWRPSGLARAYGALAGIAAGLALVQALHPAFGISAFCHIENLLGWSCL